MTTLLLAHAASAVLPLYQAALPGVRVVPFVSPCPGLSAAYDALALRCREHGGRVLPGLLAWLEERGAAPIDPGAPLALAWWSSGYALARALARHPADRAVIDAWIGLDGGHTSLDPDGSANDAGVAWAVELARAAAAGGAPFWFGHSDVEPGAYASTTKFAREVLRLAGPARAGWYVEAHDELAGPVAEHVAALRGWGPYFVARALQQLGDPSSAAPKSEVPLGERAVVRSLAELQRGAGERPAGSNAGPDVRAYLAGCVRDLDGDGDLERLQLVAGDYCAAAACWAAYAELLPHEAPPPHAWRAAGIEIERDAITAGAWRSAQDALAGRYAPRRGDLAIWQRGAPGSWTRHVARILEVGVGGAFATIGANETDRWKVTARHVNDVALRGFVVY